MEHEPVLADTVTDLFAPALGAGGVVIDATLGRAGHAERLLTAFKDIELVGIDKDPVALEESGARLEPFASRVRLVRGDFARLPAILERLGITEIRGVLLDLGVSSPQLDEADRGFSYRQAGPLDMRMDPSQSLTAEVVVNTYPEARLAHVLRDFGEERFSSRVARAIVRARPVRTTTTLAEITKEAIPAATRRTGGHPARRTFQALRIEVNGELDALEQGLPEAIGFSSPGGRVIAICYHSLEDRIVKKLFNEQARGCVCPPDFPMCQCGQKEQVRVLTKRPIRPTAQEIQTNPRSEAAKLRAVERLATDDEVGPVRSKSA
jgi:16S rRNA (cytosine1402-N4)-methyltransferase